MIGASLSVLASIMMALFAPAAVRVFGEFYFWTVGPQPSIPIAARDLALAATSAILFTVGSGFLSAGLRINSLNTFDGNFPFKLLLVAAVAHTIAGLAIIVGCAIAGDRIYEIWCTPTILTPTQVRDATFLATVAVTSGYLTFAAASAVLLVATAVGTVARPACPNFARGLIVVSASVFATSFIATWFVDVRPLASSDWTAARVWTKPTDAGSPVDYLLGILLHSQIAGFCIIAIGLAYLLVIQSWSAAQRPTVAMFGVHTESPKRPSAAIDLLRH